MIRLRMPIAWPPRLTMKTVKNGRNQWSSREAMKVQFQAGSSVSE